MWSVIWGRTGTKFFWWRCYPTEGEGRNFWAYRETTSHFPPLVGHLDLCIGKTLRRVFGLLTVICKEWVRVFSFKGFTACKVKDGKEVAFINFLMAFNLLKIIYPFHGKKHLRTKWNLNCNPQEYWIGY